MKILTFIGGISKESINRKLFELIKPLAPSEFEFEVFDITGLPYYSQDLEGDLPEYVKSLKDKIVDADGILFITPEYNRSIPGVLKNAVDWASRPAGKGVWGGKSVGTLGASLGAIGTFGAQMQLKQTMSFFGANVMWQPEIYLNFRENVNANGELSEMSKKFYTNYLNSFKSWIERHSGK